MKIHLILVSSFLLFTSSLAFSNIKQQSSYRSDLSSFPNLQELDKHTEIYEVWIRKWVGSENHVIYNQLLPMALEVYWSEKNLGFRNYMLQILRDHKFDCIIDGCKIINSLVEENQFKSLFSEITKQYQSLKKATISEFKAVLKANPNSIELKYYLKNETLKVNDDTKKIKSLVDKLNSAAHPTKARKARDSALMIAGGLLLALLLLASGGTFIFAFAFASSGTVIFGGILVSLFLAVSSLLPLSMMDAGHREGIIQNLSQTKEYSEKHLRIMEEISAMSISPDDSSGLKLLP